MSMPQIPDIRPHIDLKREDVVTLLLASVALEEMSLSHILNAEGEKLQAVLAAATQCRHPDLAAIRDINESAERTVSGITRMQMLLQMKTENILRFADRPRCPHAPGQTGKPGKSHPVKTGENSAAQADSSRENFPFRLWGSGEGYREEAGPESGISRLKARIGLGKQGTPHCYLKYYATKPIAESSETVELTLLPSDFRSEVRENGLQIHGKGILGGTLPEPGSRTEFVLRITGRGRELSFRMQFSIPGRSDSHDSGDIRVVSGNLELN